MAANMNSNIESLVREKVEDELKYISLSVKGRESRELSKTTKEFSDIVLSEIVTLVKLIQLLYQLLWLQLLRILPLHTMIC